MSFTMSIRTSGWNKCDNCNILLHSKDEQTHHEFCSNFFQEKIVLPHAYIKNGILHTFVKKTTGDLTKLSSNFKNSLLLMHPSTMKLLNFVKDDLLLLKNEKGCLVLRCWPSSKIESNQFVMSLFFVFCHYTKTHFEISRFRGEIDLADKIVLHFEDYKSFMESKNFKKFIRKSLGDFYFTQGLKINASYLGYLCCFNIEEIASSSLHQEGKTMEKFIHNLCSNFSSLNVTSTETNEPIENLVHEKALDCSEPFTPRNKPHSKKRSRNHRKKFSNTKFFALSENTQIFIHHSKKDPASRCVSFKDFGGLAENIEEIKAYFDKFLLKDLYHSQGILLIGPSGTGKSMMLNAIKSEYKLPVFNLKKHFYIRNGDSYKNELKDIFKEASESAPSIILIDELDRLCKKQRNSQQNSRAAIELSALIQNILISKKVMVVATARNISDVDLCLRKPGVLEKEITFPVLSLDGRKQVLSKMLSKYKHRLSHQQISSLSDITHGFTGGDIQQFFEKARLHSLLKEEQQEISDEPLLTWMDFKDSLKDVKPSSMVEFKIEVPNVKWSDIGGMHNVKSIVTEMVDWPLKHAEQFKKFNITPSRGILLYGPPGCSKTMIAKALVSESHLNFISVKGPQLFNKYVGESEKCVSELFKKARLAAPCVLFFDEIDSLATVRGSTSGNSNVADRVLTQLLIEIDGIDVLKGVSIIAATNRPDMIDPSLLRPGRFDHMIYVPLPDVSTRKEIFEVKLKKMPIASDVDIGYLVDATDNFTGAEITDLCREAAMLVITDNVMSSTSVITMDHFLSALHSVCPRTTKDTIEFYENYANKFL